jgi:DNA-directed RNA polymerase subunit beta'
MATADTRNAFQNKQDNSQAGYGPKGPQADRIDETNAICRISLASPDQILRWSSRQRRQAEHLSSLQIGRLADEIDPTSFGEVKKPETINYRTFKPEKDGLFCERIFGPVKDWECSCGKYKRIKYKGIVCDRCGVEVTESKVRRHRMGHIKLAAPVCHIWFYKGTSSRIANLLDISVRDLGKVLYFQEYIVVEPGDTPLKEKQLLTDEEARKYQEVYGDRVKIMIGAAAIRDLLKKIKIVEDADRLMVEMRQCDSVQKRTKIIKRLKVLEAFRSSDNRPEWMILEVLPVIPPDLRPLVHLDGGRFATSDLNDLYRRVINRNNRLKRLMELHAPDVILRNEKRMLQEAVDALFDNSRRSRPTKGHNNRPLKSLSDMLKGKQGRFRQNLLGKRVDYSGRSVIVVGPELNFNQCGLPKKMALELFDPFIIHELQLRGYCNTIKSAKRMIEKEEPVVYDILDDVIRDHPVLLNRAPTLHRLGVQAFMPKLVEGKAINLHPLACSAFNADFDGDQMAVHIPLSAEARMEAQLLMLAENNILTPASGMPIAVPSQDMVLGLFYLTKPIRGAKGEGMKFFGPEEVLMANQQGIVGLHAEIQVRIDGKPVLTTPGRMIFGQALPKEVDYFNPDSQFHNQTMIRKSLAQLVDYAHRHCGAHRTAQMLDAIMKLGFAHAKRAGMSICVDDMKVPEGKAKTLKEASKKIQKVGKRYEQGTITNEERYFDVINIWSHASEEVAKDMADQMKNDQNGMNPIYVMAHSGARGNMAQIRQLAGMRGLMQKPTKRLTGGIGEIIESPIQANFREGLTVLEYFISTHGARKGLADTALKTSDAGYLTRRLVDIAQDLIVSEDDCGTDDGIEVTSIKEVTTEGERVLEPLRDRIAGRVAVKRLLNPVTKKVIVERNETIDEATACQIENAGFEMIKIRSVLTCQSRRGVCARCYGRNLATGRDVEMGEAVGIIAAQSIGEPGTQLTLRTFHIGGTASLQLEGWYEAIEHGVIHYREGLQTVQRIEESGDKVNIVICRTGAITVEDANGHEIQVLPNIPYGAIITKKDGEKVVKGEKFVVWDTNQTPIISENPGLTKFVDIIRGVTVAEDIDSRTGNVQLVILEHKEDRHPQIQVLSSAKSKKKEVIATYNLTSGAIIVPGIQDGSEIQAGQVLARLPRLKYKSKDITGGLPRIDELFEARKPKDAATISEVDGKIEIRGIHKGSRKLAVVADDGQEYVYLIPLNRHLIVRDGERVGAGDALTDGSINPHDLLHVMGEKAVQEFILREVQEVYRLQGVTINDKHIECIIRQMLRKVIVTDVGDTRLLFGQQVDKHYFNKINAETRAEGGKPSTARPKLLGLTKASLETDSFISAASFQETTRVLTDAAVRGRYDYLRGLKENVIMGLLIPAGTGLSIYKQYETVPEASVLAAIQAADEAERAEAAEAAAVVAAEQAADQAAETPVAVSDAPGTDA